MRVGIEKNYREVMLLPNLRFWHYNYRGFHFGIQIEWLHWGIWVVFGKS